MNADDWPSDTILRPEGVARHAVPDTSQSRRRPLLASLAALVIVGAIVGFIAGHSRVEPAPPAATLDVHLIGEEPNLPHRQDIGTDDRPLQGGESAFGYERRDNTENWYVYTCETPSRSIVCNVTFGALPLKPGAYTALIIVVDEAGRARLRKAQGENSFVTRHPANIAANGLKDWGDVHATRR